MRGLQEVDRVPDNGKLTDGSVHELTRMMGDNYQEKKHTKQQEEFKVVCGGRRTEHRAAAFHCKTLNTIGHFKNCKRFPKSLRAKAFDGGGNLNCKCMYLLTWYALDLHQLLFFSHLTLL